MTNNALKKVFFISFIGFVFFMLIRILYNQEDRFAHYNTEFKELNKKELELNQNKDNMLKKKELVNTDEYIENIAREQWQMYKPNERVYININVN